jgi:hypothetical protein
MTDPIDSLERELREMKPRQLPREVQHAIESRVADARSRSWGDRCLVGAMSAGAMAACVIAALMAANSWSASAGPGPAISEAQMPGFADRPVMLAGADFQWADEQK